jgi:hypothetical protein
MDKYRVPLLRFSKDKAKNNFKDLGTKPVGINAS